LLEAVEVGREAAVHADDLVVDDGHHGQRVEAVAEQLPQLDIISVLKSHLRLHSS